MFDNIFYDGQFNDSLMGLTGITVLGRGCGACSGQGYPSPRGAGNGTGRGNDGAYGHGGGGMCNSRCRGGSEGYSV